MAHPVTNQWQIARCEPECGWSYGPSQDPGAVNRACRDHDPHCPFGGPIIDWCAGPKPPRTDYDDMLLHALRSCDVEDYSLGVTTGEDDTTRWIKITFAKEHP